MSEQNSNKKELKILIVGDGRVGKTYLATVFTSEFDDNGNRQENRLTKEQLDEKLALIDTTIFENHTMKLAIDGQVSDMTHFWQKRRLNSISFC